MYASFSYRVLLLGFFFLCATTGATLRADEGSKPVFRAGAAAVDITPTSFPVIIAGNFTEQLATKAVDRLHARAIVLDDGTTKIAIVVVDSCGIEARFLDEAKRLAHDATGIPTDCMLIAATHSHSAPSSWGVLGSRVDEKFTAGLIPQIARAIQHANAGLEPARIGWSAVSDPKHTHNRRWILRSDKMQTDPFGVRSVRAMMHPGFQNPNYIGPSGPVDTELSLVGIRSTSGRPIAALANYSQHYFGAPAVSADYYGRFAERLAELIDAEGKGEKGKPAPVAIMSQGTSGDLMWMDYGAPRTSITMKQYADEVADVAYGGWQKIQYRNMAPLKMEEQKVKFRRRTPDVARLNWAKPIAEKIKDRQPGTIQEVYAKEALILAAEPEVELKLQAIAVGDLSIAAIPNEVFALTGLKLKGSSPYQQHFTMELANGSFGYIPPPEQHKLGGYTTWPARSAGLEEHAEPKIVDTLQKMLYRSQGIESSVTVFPESAYSAAVSASKPVSYWPLCDMDETMVLDVASHHMTSQIRAAYESGIALFLDGPTGSGIEQSAPSQHLPRKEAREVFANSKDSTPKMSRSYGSRAAHFAGGRVRGEVPNLGQHYSVELWFWNGFPNDVRPITGYFYSRGQDGDFSAAGDHWGISGTIRPGEPGRLFFFNGNVAGETVVGGTSLEPKTWHHIVLVRDGENVRAYLDGRKKPELEGRARVTTSDKINDVFIGGRCDNFANFEGKLAHVAIFNRVLTPREAEAHYVAAIGSKMAAASSIDDVSAQKYPDGSQPLSPADSLAAWQVSPGYKVELVAAEPLVKDPVAIDWGADGKLWVAEMADYPLGMDGHGKPGGRIRYLEDTDGDGKYDRSALFLDGVNFPNGILAWGRGVLVTAAPEIFYAEDTDGDGKADVRKPLYTGFVEGNQQLRVNGLRLGFDNWIYCASGAHFGGYGDKSKIRGVASGTQVALGSRDFRIRPEQGLLDPQSGPAQFGRDRDDWGNWFGVQNSYPLWHYVLEDHYLRRNLLAAPPDPRQQLTEEANPKVYPAAREQKRYHNFQESGRFTSSCSAMIYRDDMLFPRGAVEHSFTCEPVHNMVHHRVLKENGVTFTAARPPEESNREFLASSDSWCRPVMVRTGPDGALWVVDMYRYMIEHPEWLPPEGQREMKPFYRAGEDRGRIYRVVRADQQPRPIPRLDGDSTRPLVARLASQSGAIRDMAQRLILAQADPAAVPLLVSMAKSEVNPLARLHALCTLDGMNRLTPELILAALTSPVPGLRRQAVRLAETQPATATEVAESVAKLASDPDAKVRLQLACTLGNWDNARAAEALGKLAVAAEGDRFMTAAVLSSINRHNLATVLETVFAAQPQPPQTVTSRLCNMAIAMDERKAVEHLLHRATQPTDGKFLDWQFATLAAMFDALPQVRTADAHLADEVQSSSTAAIAAARAMVVNEQADESGRASAVGLLLREPAGRRADIELAARLLTPQVPIKVQAAVVDRLARQSEPDAADTLLKSWRGYSPPLRAAVLSAIVSRPEWVRHLMAHLDDGTIQPAELSLATRQRLLSTSDASLKAELEKRLGRVASDRQQALNRASAALTLTGNSTHGALIFEKKCSSCHQIGKIGRTIGPNLASVTNKTPTGLLESILDPSRSVEAKYLNYIATLTDGRTLNGILEVETGSSITILNSEGQRQTVLRTEIEDLRSSGKSLMPDGLEQDLKPQDLADLIGFVLSAE